VTTVLIIAAAPALRAGLRALLAGEDIQVAGEAGTFAGDHPLAPAADVILLADAELLADAGRALPPDARVALVLLADDPRAAAQLRALPLSGWAMLAPEAGAEELRAAVRAAAAGLVTLAPPHAARLLTRPPAETLPDPGAEPLTGREREVLDLVGQGLSNKLIARQLLISEHTVKFHLSSIFAKLGASSRTDAVNRAARQGLITL
jgi:DNA-binding NarL/FixJ family response regulator